MDSKGVVLVEVLNEVSLLKLRVEQPNRPVQLHTTPYACVRQHITHTMETAHDTHDGDSTLHTHLVVLIKEHLCASWCFNASHIIPLEHSLIIVVFIVASNPL